MNHPDTGMPAASRSLPRIYLSPPHLGGSESGYVSRAFSANWIAPAGPDIEAFEQELCASTGARHAVALSSGTAALHLALRACGVRPGDHVLCPTFTFAGSAFPITYCGATPVFVDSDLRTWNIDPDLFEQAVVDLDRRGRRPRAAIVVHLYGIPADLDPLVAICSRYNIALIEDAAESLGATYGGRQTGTIAALGVYSFNGNKIITTGGGGMLVCHDPATADAVRYWSTQARDNAPHYQHRDIGYNYRMSNIAAAIGRGQLEVLDERIAARRRINTWYRTLFAKVPGCAAMPDFASGTCWLTCMTFDPSRCGFTHEELRLALEKGNIESRPLWKPMHLQPVFAAAPWYGNGVAQRLFEQGLCLPSGSALGREEQERIATAIAPFTSRFSNR